jgi:hypothetical protein
MRFRLRLKAGSLGIQAAPTLSGDAVVGQTIYATPGTYAATPDSVTPTWTVGGVTVSDATGDSLLINDIYAGLVIGYSEVAHKAGYVDSASNAATSTGAVANIDGSDGTTHTIPSAITAFSRTSSSGDNTSAFGMQISITFGSNVYAGYMTRWEVFSSSTLVDANRTQDVYYRLTDDDLQAGANLPATLLANGFTKMGATSYLRVTVFTTSPNGIGYTYTYPTTLSPTDAAGHRYWKYTVTSGSYSVLRSIIAATSIGGADAASGQTYTYTPSNCQSTSGSNQSSFWFDGNDETAGSFDTNTAPLPNAVTIDFGTNVDLHELRLKQYSPSPFPPSAFTFAYSDDNSSFTNVVSASGLTWSSDEIKTWSW